MSFFRKKEKSLKKLESREIRTYKIVYLRTLYRNIGDFLIKKFPEDYKDNINSIKKKYFQNLKKKIKINDSTPEKELLYSKYISGENVEIPRKLKERIFGDYKVSIGKKMLKFIMYGYKKKTRKKVVKYTDINFLKHIKKNIDDSIANMVEDFVIGLLKNPYIGKSAFETHDERELIYGQRESKINYKVINK